MNLETQNLLKECEKSIEYKYFNAFIKPLKVENTHNGHVRIVAPSSGIMDHVRKRYSSIIADALKKTVGDKEIRYVVDAPPEPEKITKKSDPVHDISYDKPMSRLKKYLESYYDFRYNLITSQPEFKSKNEKVFKVLEDRDISSVYLRLLMNRDFQHVNKDYLINYLNSNFIQDYHPIRGYFEKNKDNWNGRKDYIREFASCVPCKSLDFELYFRKWLNRAIHQVISDSDFSNEYCLVLYSTSGGFYKTSYWKAMIPRDLTQFYNKRIPDNLKSTDNIQTASQIFIWNLDELDQVFKRQSSAELRDFLSSEGARARTSYAKYQTRLKRRCSFVGTTNSVKVLVDQYSTRRYVIFEILEKIDIVKAQSVDVDAMWAQAYNIYLKTQKNKLHLTQDEIKAIEENNKRLLYKDTELSILLKYFKPLDEKDFDEKNKRHVRMSATEILEYLKQQGEELEANEAWIGRNMKKLAFKQLKQNRNKRGYIIQIRVKRQETVETVFSPPRHPGGVR